MPEVVVVVMMVMLMVVQLTLLAQSTSLPRLSRLPMTPSPYIKWRHTLLLTGVGLERH